VGGISTVGLLNSMSLSPLYVYRGGEHQAVSVTSQVSGSARISSDSNLSEVQLRRYNQAVQACLKADGTRFA